MPGLKRLHAARVVVVGLGAVGSYAVEALARAGVGHLRLVDHDVVHVSNINRQLFALHDTIGRKKADLARERVLKINPKCDVETLDCFVRSDTAGQILSPPLDLVVDAIDTLMPKVHFLLAAQAQKLTIVSSMGAALRIDPHSIRVGPLAGVRNCPMARQVRKRLRQRGAQVDFTCVYSMEPVKQQALDEKADEITPAHAEPQAGLRPKQLGTLPTITGIFGLTLAHESLRILLGGDFRASQGATP